MKSPSTRYYNSCLQAVKEQMNYDSLTVEDKKKVDEELDKLPIDDGAVTEYIRRKWPEKSAEIFKKVQEIIQSKNVRDSSNPKQKNNPTTGDGYIELRDCLVSKGTYFIDQNGDYFARVFLDDHFEIISIENDKFYQYCIRIWEDEIDTSKLISNDAIKRVIQSLKSRIIDRKILETRCAVHDDVVYYDLCDEKWQQIKITRTGWEIITDGPVYFRRSPIQAEQCLPEKNGTLTSLDQFLNLDDAQKILFKSILPGLLLAHIARPIILPYGEEGSGKSILSWLLKDILDPTFREKGDFPSEESDYDLVCEQEFFPLFDNVHKLPTWAEDALSTTITGRSTIKRKLYTNKDTVVTTFKRTIILNGISIPVKNSDCLQRTLLLKTKPLSESQRISEKEFKIHYSKEKPKILGAVFDLLTQILNDDLAKYHVETRLLEFAQAATSASTMLGYSKDVIPSIYQTLQDAQNSQAREASPIWDELCKLSDEGFEGTTQELGINLAKRLDTLSKSTVDKIKSAQWLGTHLSRLSRQLRLEGISWEESREGKKGNRIKSLKRVVSLSANTNLSTINSADKPKENTLSAVVSLSVNDNPLTSPGKLKSDSLSATFIDDKTPSADKLTSILPQKFQELADFMHENDKGQGITRNDLLKHLNDNEDALVHHLASGNIFECTPGMFKLA